MQSTCLTNCTATYYEDPNSHLNTTDSGSAGNRICRLCHNYCYRCYGPNDNQCWSCDSTPTDAWLMQSTYTCLTNCTATYYEDPNSHLNTTDSGSAGNRICRLCHNYCYRCYGPDVDQCWSCDSSPTNSWLMQSTCLTNCTATYYEDPNSYLNTTDSGSAGNRICRLCHNYCYRCYGPNDNQCWSCDSTPTDAWLMQSTYTCLTNCTATYYEDPNSHLNTTDSGSAGNRICRSCHNYCYRCYGPDDDQCWSCDSTPTDVWLMQSTHTCLTNCTATYYEDPNSHLNTTDSGSAGNRICRSCHNYCYRCYGPDDDQCWSCDSKNKTNEAWLM